MPELPEVETVRRTLAPELEAAVVRRVDMRSRDVVGRPHAETFAAELAGSRFTGAGRRGKYLLLPVAPGPRVLVVHLRMTGRLVLAGPEDPEPPHTHVVFQFEDGRLLRFADVRRFGRLYLYEARELPADVAEAAGAGASGRTAAAGPDGSPGLFTLGPEPLSRRFDARLLGERLRGRKAPIKAVLLDQRVVAGLGNIYVDEALFRAGIHPARPAGDLAPDETRRLVREIRSVIRQAVERRGTTLSDYVDGYGRPGSMGPHLAVYGRSGEPCRRCRGPVEKIRVAGRGTHLCPRCQPARREGHWKVN